MTGISEALDRLRIAVSAPDGTVTAHIGGRSIRIELSDDSLEVHDEKSLQHTVEHTLRSSTAAFGRARELILDKVYADVGRPDPDVYDRDGRFARYGAAIAAITATGRSDRGLVVMDLEPEATRVRIAPRAITRVGYDGVLAELNSALARLEAAISHAKTVAYGDCFWNGDPATLGADDDRG